MAQAGTLLPLGEGSSVSQAGSQASQAVTSQPGAHLLPGKGSSLAAGSQAPQASQVAGRPVTSPSPKEGGSLVVSPASQAGTHLSPAEENSSQAGQASSQVTRSGMQHPRHSARQRALQAFQGIALPPRQTVLVPGMAIQHLTPLIGSLKGLPQKTPTLSGSLTYPANLWHQHKGLFWLRDPTLW